MSGCLKWAGTGTFNFWSPLLVRRRRIDQFDVLCILEWCQAQSGNAYFSTFILAGLKCLFRSSSLWVSYNVAEFSHHRFDWHFYQTILIISQQTANVAPHVRSASFDRIEQAAGTRVYPSMSSSLMSCYFHAHVALSCTCKWQQTCHVEAYPAKSIGYTIKSVRSLLNTPL